MQKMITLLTVSLLGFIHVVCLEAALHPAMDSGRVLIGGIMLFFGLLGNLLGRVRRNLWLGVRTPWTLTSDRVWIAAHRLAARLFTLAGFVSAGLVWAGVPVIRVFLPFLFALLFPVFYSWWVYRQLGVDNSGTNLPDGNGNGGGMMALLLATLSLSATGVQAAPREVTFTGAGGLQLQGTLLLPDLPTPVKPSKFPAVLLLPGSGTPDRDGNAKPLLTSDLLKRLAEKLAAQGIASLRYDKRSVKVYAKEWPSDPEKLGAFLSWEQFTGDALAAYRFLRQQPEIQATQTGIAGHSEGGLITLQLAHDLTGTPEAPAAIALLATAGRTIDIVLREQIAALLAEQTDDQRVIRSYLDYMDRAIAQIKKEGTVPLGTPPGLIAIFNPTVLPLLRAYFTVEPTRLAAKYTGPVLIVQGAKDKQVSVERDAPRLLSTFQKRTIGTVEMVTIPGVGHQFQSDNPQAIDTDPTVAPPTDPTFLSRVPSFFYKTLTEKRE